MQPNSQRPPGLLASLRAGLLAGAVCGLLLGLLDGTFAGIRTSTHGLWTWVGCLGATVVSYGLTWMAVLAVVSVFAHPLLRRKERGARLRALMGLGLGVGLSLDLAWWTRPYILWGVPATDPRRVAAFAGMLLAGLALGAVLVAAGKRLPRGALLAGAVLLPVAWGVGAFHLLHARDLAAQLGKLNDRTKDRPNVLLVVVDAMRQDVLGCYGNKRVKTPVIDALAARGVVFENAWAQAPFTWSSFGSILTGKYPRRHGLVKMAPGVRMAKNITLPFHLKSASLKGEAGQLDPDDYAGAAFLTGTLSHGSGLLRGFDVYFEAMVGHDLVELDNPWSVFRSELVLSLVRTKVEARFLRLKNEDPVAQVAREWLGEHADRRWAAMLHFYSTHTPYDPPQRFREMYVDPAYGGPIQAFYASYREAIERGEYAPTDADRAHIANLYYGGVSQADAMLGEILDELERRGALDNTLVILTADHGEELGDHGVWEHNFMYETNLRVPLVMALPGRLPAGVRSSALVESVDIVPTVCALLDVEPPYEADQKDEQGRDRGAIDGFDLGPLVRGAESQVHAHAFAENGVYLAVRDLRYKLVVAAESLQSEDWRSSPRPGVARAALYDLQKDPDERENAIERLPDEANRLIEVARAFDDQMPVPHSEVVQSDRDREAEERLLRELGYAGGVGQGAQQPPVEGSVKDPARPDAKKPPQQE
jgi:arylsulfatase A-like enzyme